VRARSKLASLVKLAVLMVVLWVGLSALPVLARPHSSRDLLLAQHLGKPVKTYNSPPPMVIDPAKSYTATMETTAGTMVLELFPQEAPLAVNNFVFLANDHFYDGVIFHRVIRGFMIQGGDPTGTGRGGPGYRFPDEPVQRPYSRGTLAMANAGPNTNGSQFFIMHADYPLPPNYTIFGQLIEGEDVLDKIATAPTGPQDRPLNPVEIQSVRISESN
jgi:cyclophilin family peptidyl-prolyl cis-trans isomerase